MLTLLELQKRDVVVFVKNIRKTGPTNFYSTGSTHDPYSEEEINLLFVEHRMKQDGQPQMPQSVFKKPFVKYVIKEYVKPVIHFDSDSEEEEIKPIPIVKKEFIKEDVREASGSLVKLPSRQFYFFFFK